MAGSLGLKGTNLFVLGLIGLVYLVFAHYVVEGVSVLSDEEDLELERQLRILNKPRIKTIQSEWGDTYDCVDIYKQPAFDHPLLKNHEIQMKPNFIPETVGGKESKVQQPRAISTRNVCPSGTVPIRRTQKEDLIRAKSLKPMSFLTADASGSVQYQAGVLYQVTGEAYYGATAEINTFNPDRVQPDQFTSAELFVGAGPFNEMMNAIYVGWTVNPDLYGNNITRSFTYWTGGNGIGCYNTMCPGFVQVDKVFTPDYPIDKVSIYEGVQYPIRDKILQDRQTGNWWLIYDNKISVGYWPNTLFPLFGAGAQYIYWGGQVGNHGDQVTPRMGNGRFPDGDFTHATYIAKMQYIDGSNNIVDPNGDEMKKILGCGDWVYRVRYYGYKDDEYRHALQFGGPGGKCA